MYELIFFLELNVDDPLTDNIRIHKEFEIGALASLI